MALRTFPPFSSSDNLEEFALKIVSIKEKGKRVHDYRYDCVFLCCESPVVLSHRQIERRITSKSRRCASCGAKEGARKRMLREGKIKAEKIQLTSVKGERVFDKTIPPTTRHLRPWEVLER